MSQTRGEPRKTRGNHLFKDSHRKGGVIFLKTHKRGSVPQTSSDPADLPTLKTKDAITMKHVCTIAAKPCRCVCLCVCISMRVQGKGGKGARGEAGGVWEGEGARGGGREGRETGGDRPHTMCIIAASALANTLEYLPFAEVACASARAPHTSTGRHIYPHTYAQREAHVRLRPRARARPGRTGAE